MAETTITTTKITTTKTTTTPATTTTKQENEKTEKNGQDQGMREILTLKGIAGLKLEAGIIIIILVSIGVEVIGVEAMVASDNINLQADLIINPQKPPSTF